MTGGATTGGAPSEYTKEADLETKTPNMGAMMREISHPTTGMLPIAPTMRAHTNMTMSHRMYVPAYLSDDI